MSLADKVFVRDEQIPGTRVEVNKIKAYSLKKNKEYGIRAVVEFFPNKKYLLLIFSYIDTSYHTAAPHVSQLSSVVCGGCCTNFAVLTRRARREKS